MKLLFYSDQIIEENKRIDHRLLQGYTSSEVKVGYIPSGGDPDRKYFVAQKQYYEQYGIKDFAFFDLDADYDPFNKDQLQTATIIHLSGGDPIYFLTNMKKRGFLSVLQSYASEGGTIAGVSGGGVLLGKNAALFKLFQSDLTTALENCDNLQTLGLVDFEFLPHYNRWNDAFKREVEEYTSLSGATVYACDDGSGIIVEHGNTDFIGTVYQVKDGGTRKVSF